MTYSYRSSYREGVVFAFITDNHKILIERRNNNNSELFFPSGSIEVKDYSDEEDYRLIALKREIHEEFAGNVEIKKYIRLTDVVAENINVIFYVYLIEDWEGIIPCYTIENDEKDGELEWIDLFDYKKYFQFESAHLICKEIINRIDNKI